MKVGLKTRTENLKQTDRCRRTQPNVSYPLRYFASIVIYDNLNRLRERWRKEEGGSYLLIVSGLETNTTNWKKCGVSY